ncbi:MAG: YjbH domain-containing protein, partial [Aeromonadaceae bacterium]
MKPFFSISLLACLVAGYCHADPVGTRYRPELDGVGPSQQDFGGVGLMQMPTARMARVGEFSANYMDNEQYRRWSVSLQPFEWFEATMRYTDVRTQYYSGDSSFSGDQTYKDKGFDFKFRLWEESSWLPMTSLGVRDIAGTGLFDSEFIAASKRWHNLDFTLGMGWGNMAQSGNIKNPFCTVSDGWCERN